MQTLPCVNGKPYNYISSSYDSSLCEDGKTAVRFTNTTTTADDIDYRLYKGADCTGYWYYKAFWNGIDREKTSSYACAPQNDYYVWSNPQEEAGTGYCSSGSNTYKAGYKYNIMETDTDYIPKEESAFFKSFKISNKSAKILIINDNKSFKGIEAKETIK